MAFNPANPRPAKTPRSPVRIGAVNYLNSKPLVHGLQQRLPEEVIRFDLPSRLAASLAEGRLDIALIPCVEVLRRPEYRIISDACVASDGPVLSVKVYFRRPPAEVCSLALDEGSRTSAALAQVLLAERHGVRPELTELPIGCGSETARADAVLLIGDRAMLPAREPFVEEWDLGAEWQSWTGLPFVFACWAARVDATHEAAPDATHEARSVDAITEAGVVQALSAARDAGVAAIREIARAEAPLLGIDADAAHSYLENNLHFHLGEQELKGLRLFEQRCAALGLLDNQQASS